MATATATITTALPAPLSHLAARVAPNSSELPSLKPQKPFDAALTNDIEDYVKKEQGGKDYVRCALHILNDDISRAHDIAQADDDNTTSNLCHAILHRREGDYWNSKWWYGKIRHPLIKEIYGSTSEAQSLVDAVQKLDKDGSASTPCAAGNVDTLKRKQADELAMLVQYVLTH